MAESVKVHVINDVAIVDVNDLGGNILGNTSKIFSDDLISKILQDNLLGQSNELTLLGIIRKSEVPREKT